MKSKWVWGAVLLLLTSTAAFGRSYRLAERSEVDLSRVDEVFFDLRGVSCALCIRSIDIESELSGDGAGRDMVLDLKGNITSNRDKAVPKIIVDESGRSVTVRLFPPRQSFFGLSQSGTAMFTAVLPASFEGTVATTGSSDDIIVRDFVVTDMDVRSSSGDLEARNINAETTSFRVSSGDFRGDAITGRRRLSIDSSSGDVSVGTVTGNEITVEASSGDITIGDAAAEDRLTFKASSGRIGAGSIVAGETVLHSSSGRITVERLETGAGRVDVSSGDVTMDSVKADTMNYELSSGELRLGYLESGRTIIKTSSDASIEDVRGAIEFRGSSGDVEMTFGTLEAPVDVDVSSGNITLTLPEGAAFDAELDTSSGRIRSEFPVLGDLSAEGDAMKGTVNGGGIPIRAETSSGDIRLLVR